MDDLEIRELAARLAILAAGGRRAPMRRLLSAHGSAWGVLQAGIATWRAAGVAEDGCLRLRRGCDPVVWERTLDWMRTPGRRLLACHEPAYPQALKSVGAAPLLLFASGNTELLQGPAVAVVGSRSPTADGLEAASAMGASLAQAGLAVVSGLAAGIDAAAHGGALSGQGGTVAVLGCGPDLCFPASNRALFAEIEARGLLLTEHPPGTPPMRTHFPSRNRIVAGLALGTVVVEAAERSGALITARLAADAGREVFAMPGSVRNAKARGCHALLRDGATLVECAQDVITALAPQLRQALRTLPNTPAAPATPTTAACAPATKAFPAATRDTALAAPAGLDPTQQAIWDALGFAPLATDVLIGRTGLSAAALATALLPMELAGWVHTQHGRVHRTSTQGAVGG